MTFTPNTTQRIAAWVSAEEFGAAGNGSTNDTSALQDAINYAISNGIQLHLTAGRTYLISQSLNVTVNTGLQNLFLEGNGAIINMSGSDYAFKIRAGASYVTGLPQFRNLIVSGANASGFDVGQNNDTLNPPSIYGDGRGPMFYNILTSQLGGTALQIQNASHFDVDKFVARNDNNTGDGVRLLAGSGAFTGDITFNDCQFQSQADGHYAANLNSYSTVGAQFATKLRGIRFNSCVFYGGETLVGCSTNGQTADIWFNNCAWDGNGRPVAVRLDIAQNGQMNKVLFSDFYMVGYTEGFQMRRVSSNASVSNVKLESGMIGSTTHPIYALSMTGFDIQNCTFDGCTTDYALINIDAGSTKFKISDNMELNGSGSYFISLSGTGTQRFVCSNNVCYDVSNVVNDVTGGVAKQVLNNVKL